MKSRLRHPIRAIREPFGKAGLAVAILALVLAMVGGAYAAGALTGKQKKEVEKIAKKYAGKPGAPGAAGANGTNGTNGKDGSAGAPGADGKSVLAKEIPKSSTTCTKQGGTEFEVDGSGKAEKVCNGTTGFTKTLPKGETETGAWTFGPITDAAVPLVAGNRLLRVPLASFAIPLKEELDGTHVHYIKVEEAAPEGCTGNVKEPGAELGNLCVFASREEGAVHEIQDPTTLTFAQGAGTTGAILLVLFEEEATKAAGEGTWAVTAE
jgi:hypothetical protein